MPAMPANPSPEVLTLDRLSHDILDLILTEIRRDHFATICALRLVSKAMNDVAEPKAFEAMTIDFCGGFLRSSSDDAGAQLSIKTPTQLMDLALSTNGKNPNARWTKCLRIPWDGLMPFHIRQSWLVHEPDEVRDEMECQDAYLVPAIRALKNVRCCNYALLGCEPKETVLSALAELPKLEELAIKFFDSDWIVKMSKKSPASLPPLFNFKNLRVLELYEDIPLCAPMVSAIAHLINRSRATLETLSLFPEKPPWQPGRQEVDDIYIDEILENTENQLEGNSRTALESSALEGQRMRLSKLIVNERLRFGELAVPFLHSLVHLEIQNTTVAKFNAEPGFWEALTRSEIHLEYLAIYPVTQALVGYLSSYTGLKELHLRSRPGKKDEFDCPESSALLFTQVLPGQRKTLRHLSFSHLRWEAWAVREEYLEGILVCNNLETLELIYYYPQSTRSRDRSRAEKPLLMDLSTLLSQISRKLRSLQRLTLTPACDYSHFRVWEDLGTYGVTIPQMFAMPICEAKIATDTPSTPTFTLYVMRVLANIYSKSDLSPLEFVFNPSRRRFALFREVDSAKMVFGRLSPRARFYTS